LNGLKIRLAFTLGLLASLLSALAYAQSYKPFPGEEIDHRTRSMQERVDAVYASGDYERALLIYEKELAPIGDKYAQYMVGYMHLNALGVNQDKETALAWYRLAAERGDQLLVQTRDELAVQLVLLMELIRRDLQILKAQTGSRIPGATVTRPTVIYRPRGGSVGPNFYRDVSTRLDARLKYLDARVEISDDIIAVELEQLQSEQSAAKEELAAIRNR
jgi:hypothetical protein